MDLQDKFYFGRELGGPIILVLTVDCKFTSVVPGSSEEKALWHFKELVLVNVHLSSGLSSKLGWPSLLVPQFPHL